MTPTHFLQNLTNQYFGIRHGESTANKQDIIATDFEFQKGVGLTSLGQKQIRQSVQQWMPPLSSSTLLVSSDFDRTIESAKHCAAALEISETDITITNKIRDRHFGDLDGENMDRVPLIQAADEADINSELHNVESIPNVLKRMVSCIEELESQFQNQQILLISHADPLTLLDFAFQQLPLIKLYENKFNNAEIRALKPLQ